MVAKLAINTIFWAAVLQTLENRRDSLAATDPIEKDALDTLLHLMIDAAQEAHLALRKRGWAG